MKKRDLEILKSLEVHKVLTRSQIAALHFKENKNPSVSANRVLKRLRTSGYIQANTNRSHSEYLYFLDPSPIKIDSQKIPHHLLINQTIIDMQQYSPIDTFQIETSLPHAEFIVDIYVKGWLGKSWFIECQNSLYTTNQLYKKLDRYVKYHDSNYHEGTFPNVLIVGETNYRFENKDYPFTIRQIKSIHDLKTTIELVKKQRYEYFKEKVWEESKTPVSSPDPIIKTDYKSENGEIKIVL